ncbi:FAD-dependent monooxygenase [Actinoplanes sp. NPDC023936]|uniref:FAD-dependent monooxygenase n=1 Tax=Actinoplanes sp. NPDC023936 TaxID=3154910 RepID=UPI0033C86979
MHALISGASIAGPVLAYWLRRYGWRVTVVERSPALRAGDGGHAVDLFGPAVEVIERMGLRDRVHAARTRNDTITLFRRHGRAPVTVATADLSTGISARHVEIPRGALAGLLHDATRDDVDYRFDTVIERLDGTHALLSDGSSVTADLVVGADGLHSGVRRLSFGPESRYRRFLGAYLAVYSLPDVLGTGPTVATFTAPRRVVAVYPTASPGRSRALLLVRSPQVISCDHRDPRTQKSLARELVEDAFDPRLTPVLAHLDTADDFYFDEIAQIRMDHWSHGHVTLVGDAGYGPGPAVGGGTSLAVAGAYVLAAELGAGSSTGVPAALARYQAALSEPVRRAHRFGRAVLGSIVPRSHAHVWLTAQTMRALPHLPATMRSRLTSFGSGPAGMLGDLTLPPAP